MVLIDVLVAVALFSIATILLISWLRPKPVAITGQVPAPVGNPVPSNVTNVSGEWVQTFPNLEIGPTYHFIYRLKGKTGGSSNTLSSITVSIAAGPAGHVVIESVNGYSSNNVGNTTVPTSVTGTIDVHLRAVSEPSDFQGAIVAIPHGAPLNTATAQFEIQKP